MYATTNLHLRTKRLKLFTLAAFSDSAIPISANSKGNEKLFRGDKLSRSRH